jgi:hypothetical protein
MPTGTGADQREQEMRHTRRLHVNVLTVARSRHARKLGGLRKAVLSHPPSIDEHRCQICPMPRLSLPKSYNGSFCELITRQAQKFRTFQTVCPYKTGYRRSGHKFRTFQTVCPYKTGYRRSGLHERRKLFRQGGMLFLPGRKVFPRHTKEFCRSCNPKKKTWLGYEPTT